MRKGFLEGRKGGRERERKVSWKVDGWDGERREKEGEEEGKVSGLRIGESGEEKKGGEWRKN